MILGVIRVIAVMVMRSVVIAIVVVLHMLMMFFQIISLRFWEKWNNFRLVENTLRKDRDFRAFFQKYLSLYFTGEGYIQHLRFCV